MSAELQADEFTSVQTDAGPVSLATVADLQQRSKQWKDWSVKAEQSRDGMLREAAEKMAAAGSVLIAQPAAWEVPPALRSTLDSAVALAEHVASDDQAVASLEQQKSEANIFSRIGIGRHEDQVRHDRVAAAAQLRDASIAVATGAPPTTLPAADELRGAAAQLQTEAASLVEQMNAAGARCASYDAEVGRRQESIKNMGFDALYESARLQTNGAEPVSTPLMLKAGEQAYVSTPATLARMVTHTRYVGGSSGFSFPIGHTGIRYRVGSYRGHPVSQQSLTKLDQGTFVVTNQRIAYVGAMKSASVPLAKLLHVEIYDDGLSVSREGKENPDWYLMSEPKRVLFLLNWVLSKRAET